MDCLVLGERRQLQAAAGLVSHVEHVDPNLPPKEGSASIGRLLVRLICCFVLFVVFFLFV